MKEQAPLAIGEDEILILEALIKSNAFPVLKKVLDTYRKQCMSVILETPDTHKIFETRGRIIGLNVIEQLPALLVQQRELKKKAELEKNRKFVPNIKTPTGG